jgi:ABC-type amino acid transport substrate-binding protein
MKNAKLLVLLIVSILSIIVFDNLIIFSALPVKASNDDIINEFISGRKKELIIGFRDASYPVSYTQIDPNSTFSDKSKPIYKGFCDTFADELFENLKSYIQNELIKDKKLSDKEIINKVNSLSYAKHPVVNFGQGGHFKRYGGVLEGKIDVECGANSIRYDQTGIEFSDDFLSSGISLLALRDNLKKVESDEKNLGGLKVGVLGGTTTYKWLREEKGYPEIKISLYTSRKDAINALNRSEIDAYVSDYIILKGLLENNQELLSKDKYDVYSKYLKEQGYGLVIKEGQSKFKEIINQTIKSPKSSEKIKYLNDHYSNKSAFSSPLLLQIDSIQKLLSNPLVTFLLGLSISGLVIIIVVPIFRQKLFEVLKGGWERILPDIVEGLYSLWKMILKLILNK